MATAAEHLAAIAERMTLAASLDCEVTVECGRDDCIAAAGAMAEVLADLAALKAENGRLKAAPEPCLKRIDQLADLLARRQSLTPHSVGREIRRNVRDIRAALQENSADGK